MREVGNLLKEARENKGLSIDDIYEKTKISRRFLREMEKGNFDRLPAEPVYIKGFIRKYCEVVGIPSYDVVAMYEKTLPKSEFSIQDSQELKDDLKRKEVARPNIAYANDDLSEDRDIERGYEHTGRKIKQYYRPARKKNHKLMINLVTIGILILIAVYLFWGTDLFGKSKDAIKEPDEQTQEQQNTSDENKDSALDDGEKQDQDTASMPEETDFREVTVTAEEGKADAYLVSGVEKMELRMEIAEGKECWMSIKSDGENVLKKTLGSGESFETEGTEELRLNLGNPTAVKVILNGKDLGYFEGTKARVFTYKLEN